MPLCGIPANTISRYHKYTLGSELRKASRDVVTGIIRANSARERLPIYRF
ncbi:MAG: hypothetical protein K2P57_06985 [Burkholderiales bacterium]|nr:hypothetical protein [Burkholderiales bacterium]